MECHIPKDWRDVSDIRQVPVSLARIVGMHSPIFVVSAACDRIPRTLDNILSAKTLNVFATPLTTTLSLAGSSRMLAKP